MIQCFTESLTEEEKNFSKVWDGHLGGKGETSGMHYYSSKMASIIEDDLTAKIDDLDFDKDPF